MPKYNEIYIFGYSGHAYVVLDVALSMSLMVKGYFDFQKAISDPYQVPYIGNENRYDNVLFDNHAYHFPAIGSNEQREKVFKFIESKGLNQTVLIHDSGFVSSKSSLGKSTLVAPRAVINSGADVGKACVINSGAVVEHECYVDDFAHIAPGAVLAGGVTVGRGAFVGANAVVKQGIIIGERVTIGAGSVVIGNIPDNETWVGNPARKLR